MNTVALIKTYFKCNQLLQHEKNEIDLVVTFHRVAQSIFLLTDDVFMFSVFIFNKDGLLMCLKRIKFDQPV